MGDGVRNLLDKQSVILLTHKKFDHLPLGADIETIFWRTKNGLVPPNKMKANY